ncbi:hypothetical protein SAMN05443575_0533 [Jatrophihabitans endophyticus]|uniref:Uncharacterized protein n=2 Tax=Jatrophihabitans endophyticus TaxID=1206085 RepID=A0A1M5DCV0_9ACTN|nr:hypothetical protein SAMN05443575_0533 [Jatrophihabitans endophyticus]
MGGVAVALLVLGLLLWALYRFTIGTERHSFAAGATPPSEVSVIAGDTYAIGIPGGVGRTAQLLPDPQSLSCSFAPAGGARRQLAVQVEPATTKALTRIATFVAPRTGRAAVSCVGLPAVFVDDAEDVGPDLAGLWLVLASVSLAVALPLLFSVLRRYYGADRPLVAVEPDGVGSAG